MACSESPKLVRTGIIVVFNLKQKEDARDESRASSLIKIEPQPSSGSMEQAVEQAA